MTEVPQPVWQELFTAARHFYLLAPWQWMGDDDVWILEDPVSGKACYHTVMGQLGDYFALAVYRGKDGLNSMLMLQEENEDQDPEATLYEQDCLIASFELEEDVDPEDMALANSLGIDLSGLDRFPGFRSYRRGFMPWVLDEAEVRLLTLCLQQAIEVALAKQGDPEVLVAPEEEKGKMYALAQENEGWATSWRKPDNLVDFSPPRLEVPQEPVDQILALPTEENTMWLFEKFFFRQPSLSEEYDRPIFPMAFMLMDMESTILMGMDLTDPFKVPETGTGLLAELFSEAGMRPENIVVSNKENYILLQPFCRACSIAIHLEEEMDVLPELKAELYKMMDGEEGITAG